MHKRKFSVAWVYRIQHIKYRYVSIFLPLSMGSVHPSTHNPYFTNFATTNYIEEWIPKGIYSLSPIKIGMKSARIWLHFSWLSYKNIAVHSGSSHVAVESGKEQGRQTPEQEKSKCTLKICYSSFLPRQGKHPQPTTSTRQRTATDQGTWCKNGIRFNTKSSSEIIQIKTRKFLCWSLLEACPIHLNHSSNK